MLTVAETNTGKPFDVTEAYSCFTADVISSYCFGESFGFLEQVCWDKQIPERLETSEDICSNDVHDHRKIGSRISESLFTVLLNRPTSSGSSRL